MWRTYTVDLNLRINNNLRLYHTCMHVATFQQFFTFDSIQTHIFQYETVITLYLVGFIGDIIQGLMFFIFIGLDVYIWNFQLLSCKHKSLGQAFPYPQLKA